MTADLHLFRLEVRRNVGLWLLPVLVGLGWFVGRDTDQYDGMVIWRDTSRTIGIVSTLLGPLVGGVAAWTAGRDRRRRLEELLTTTPRPAVARDLTAWVAAAGLALVADTLVGLYFGSEAVRDATWGGPELSPILVGIATVVAFAAIGYAAGSFFPSRYTAPLVAIALFVALLIPDLANSDTSAAPTPVESSSWMQRLSPAWLIDSYGLLSVYQELTPDLVVPMVAWLIGLGGFALAAVALRRRRTAPAWGTLLAATALALVGATTLLRADPKPVAAGAVEPVCTVNVIEVCLHPAFEARLDETATIVGKLMQPLAGIPGAPVRAVGQDPFGPVDPPPAGTVPVFLAPGSGQMASLAYELVRDWPQDGVHHRDELAINAAQEAIAMWLLEQAGYDDPFDEFRGHRAEIDAAVARFAALDPAAQRAWLEANFAALRAGELDLEDLP